MTSRTFTLAALLLLVGSVALAGERARGNLVEYQGKLYILQPTQVASHAGSGTFARGKPKEVFREMVMGQQPHADLWAKVDAIYEVEGTLPEMAALLELQDKWIDVEGDVTQTSDVLSEDPDKRAIKKLMITDLHNPKLGDANQQLRRTWGWIADVNTQSWTWRQDMTFGGAKLSGPARADLESYMPTLLDPPVTTVTTQPKYLGGTILGPKVKVQGYLHSSPQGRHFVALQTLQTIAEVSGANGTTVTGPGAGLPLPRVGLPTTAPIVAGPGMSTPVVVSGPTGPATPLVVTGPTSWTPLTKSLTGTTGSMAGTTTVTPVVSSNPALNPVVTSNPTVVPNPGMTPISAPKPGMVGALTKTP